MTGQNSSNKKKRPHKKETNANWAVSGHAMLGFKPAVLVKVITPAFLEI